MQEKSALSAKKKKHKIPKKSDLQSQTFFLFLIRCIFLLCILPLVLWLSIWALKAVIQGGLLFFFIWAELQTNLQGGLFEQNLQKEKTTQNNKKNMQLRNHMIVRNHF